MQTRCIRINKPEASGECITIWLGTYIIVRPDHSRFADHATDAAIITAENKSMNKISLFIKKPLKISVLRNGNEK